MNKDVKKVLILRLSALGDTIHTLPVVYAIKKSYPNCKIGWLVEDKAQLFVNNNPLVDKCFVVPKKDWKKQPFNFFRIFKDFKRIVDEINAENYDVVLDTQQLAKSACFLPFLNIKRKITITGGREFSHLFSNEIYEQTHDLFDSNYHVVNRNLELAFHIGADVSEIKMALKDATPEIVTKIDSLLKNIDTNKPIVVCSPATTWVNKHWRESHWSDVVSYLKDRVNIVFTGMDSDNALIERIIKGSDCSKNEVLVLAGKTNLEELAELFRRVDVVISPDSGSAHIAWAVDKPIIISLFSATAEKRSAPFGQKCYVLAPNLDCRPCMKRVCKRKSDKNLCCSLVEPSEVITLLKKVLHFN